MTAPLSDDLREFLREGREFLERIEPLLVEMLERNPRAMSAGDGAPEALNSVFRAFHSLKGVSGFLALAKVQDLCHKAEEILDGTRAGRLPPRPETWRLILRTVDFLRKLFDSIAETGADAAYGEEREDCLAALAEAAAPLRQESAPGGKGGTSEGALVAGLVPGAAGAAGDPAFLFAKARAHLQSLEESVIGALDAPDGLAAFIPLLPSLSREALGLGSAAGAAGDSKTAVLALRLFLFLEEAREEAIAGASFDAEKSRRLFGDIAGLRLLLVTPGGAGDAAWAERPEAASRASEQVEREEPAPRAPQGVAGPEKAPAQDGKENAAGRGASPPPREDVRITRDQLDDLTSQMADLGTLASSLEGASDPVRFRRVLSEVKRLGENMQSLALALQQVPLENLFRKMKRLAADAAHKLRKDAQLEIRGGDIGVDRSIFEMLYEPLVHMVRNALDHGLETPEARESVGKPRAGRLRLEAWREGGELRLSLADDGAGIDRDKVLERALSRGLCGEEASAWPDGRVFALLFEPGFSLAAGVTEFSGRGVGMDVVKRNLERLGGSIAVASQKGRGATVTLKIPLSGGLTENLLLASGPYRLALRTDAVLEIVRFDPRLCVESPDGGETLSLREGLAPLLRLASLLGVKNAADGLRAEDSRRRDATGVLVVTRIRGGRMALLCDKVLGKARGSLRPLHPYFGNLPGIGGCLVLGDGAEGICWSLDPEGLADREARDRAEKKR